jgi:hypothetical protein
MPLGNGDVGVNVWAEPGGDVVLLLSKTDAWDSHARLLKPGRVRLSVSPNPFGAGRPFRQELRLREGEIVISAGDPRADGRRFEMRVWVDAHRPVVRVDVESPEPVAVRARLDLWRTARRELTPEESFGVDGFAKDLAPVSFPDRVVDGPPDRVVWYHRNEVSLWPITLDQQGLSEWKRKGRDPLLGRTFGGSLGGEGFRREGLGELVSSAARTGHRLDLVLHTAVVPTVEGWRAGLEAGVTAAGGGSRERALRRHRDWWEGFWERSWIRLGAAAGADGTVEAECRRVTQAYGLQRFIQAAGGRGAYPIKFNGSIFTVEVPGKFDPDYRRWGGCYWFQNTRLPYWPMLASGDHDLMQPLFRMYREMLPLAKERTEVYMSHGGAFFPETLYFWGAHHNGQMGYQWGPPDDRSVRSVTPYIRFYWSGGLELTTMMLDYHAATRDGRFLRETLLPLASEIVEFYDVHYPREPSGRLLLVPAQSLETWWECENPLPEVAGLRHVLGRLLELPASETTAARREAWRRLLGILPAIPRRKIAESWVLSPAEAFRTQRNQENPELYAVFPYRLYGVGKPDLELARRTFEARQFKGNVGWEQDDTQAAFLGLAEEARKRLVDRAGRKDPNSRFPAFWGPNFDWVPDQDHGGNILMTLQTMLLQCEGREIRLFPAWPKEWNAEFKLHAPDRTTVEGSWRDGRLERLNVKPSRRAKDVIVLDPQ